MTYGVVFESATDGSVGAFSPDFPGVGVVGETRSDALAMLEIAIQWQIEAMIRDNSPLPEPSAGDFQAVILVDRTFIAEVPEALSHLVQIATGSTAPVWEVTHTIRTQHPAVA